MWFGSRITAGEMFRYVEKLSQKSSEKNKAAASGSLRKKEKLYLPPKKPEEFSANWRSLQLIEKMDKGFYKSSARSSRKRNRQSDNDDRHLRAKQKKWKLMEDVWFDDVDSETLEAANQGKPYTSKKTASSDKPQTAVQPKPLVTGDCKHVTQFIAMDCEMVGGGYKGSHSLLARVSVVNSHGHVLYDTFVKPQEPVTDYRTFVSGVRARDLKHAPSFTAVQCRVAELTEGRTIVGHALSNDMKALLLSHPYKMIRDTSYYPPFKTMAHGRQPSLRMLTKRLLNRDIQKGEHSSVEDAQAVMALYQMHKKDWESWLRNRRNMATGRTTQTATDRKVTLI